MFFGTLRKKTSERNLWYPPLIYEILRYHFFETQNGSPTMFFGTVRSQFFYRKSCYSPLRHKVFRYTKLFETQKGSSKNFFGTIRQKIFDGKYWYSFHPPPPLSSLAFSDTKSFLKHRIVPLQNVSVRWDKNIGGESWYPSRVYKIFR